MALRHGLCVLNLRNRPRLSRPSAWEIFSASPIWSTRPATGCGVKSTSFWVHRNLFWQLSKDGNSHGSGLSGATTVCRKSSFRAPYWRVGDFAVGRGHAGLTTSKSGRPCQSQNCSQWRPPKKTGGRYLLNRPTCIPNDLIGRGNRNEKTYLKRKKDTKPSLDMWERGGERERERVRVRVVCVCYCKTVPIYVRFFPNPLLRYVTLCIPMFPFWVFWGRFLCVCAVLF